MYLDSEILLSGTVASPGWSPTATGDNVSPNTHDTAPLGNQITNAGVTSGNVNTYRDLGAGLELYLCVLVTTAVTSGGSATVTFSLVTDTVTPVATFNILMATSAIPKANLTANASVFLPLARGTAMTTLYKRYIAADANIGTAVLTAGTFEVWITNKVQDNQLRVGIYQPGFSVK